MNTITISSGDKAHFYRNLILEHGSPLLVLDKNVVHSQYDALARALPGVRFYYAVKSLSHPSILRWLDSLGAGFDLATSGEIDLIRKLGVSAARTIHTHPIKRDKDIQDALDFGCTTFVLDNSDELLKFRPYKERTEVLIRVSFRSPSAIVDLSKKFGCSVQEVERLADLAEELGITVQGLSFHVGSQCTDAHQQVQAIETCNDLIRRLAGRGKKPLKVLDIGGGFPVAYDGKEINIDAYCAPIRAALTQLPPYVQVISEPGRFISGPSMFCIATIIGTANRNGFNWYYLDEGVYGSYSGQIFDHVRYPLEFFSDKVEKLPSVLAGPTCDSIDLIAEDVALPTLRIGNIMVGHLMGAYTSVTATEFNAVPKTKIVTVGTPNTNTLDIVPRQRKTRRFGQRMAA